jgi:TetR/AcrR family acrAB operon transcriptional repressor
MKRTKEEAEITRKDLIKSAWRVFSQNGYNAARLSDIAKDAGVTRGAVYWHFGNKKELFKALFKDRADSYFKLLTEIIEADLTPLEKIRALIIKTVKKIQFDEQFKAEETIVRMHNIFRGKFKDIDEYLEKRLDTFSEWIVGIIKDGQKKGEIRTDIDPLRIMFLIHMFMVGFLQIEIQMPPISSKIKNEIKDVESLVKLLFEGIKAGT